MRRLTISPLKLMLVLVAAVAIPQETSTPQAAQQAPAAQTPAGQQPGQPQAAAQPPVGEPVRLPLDLFKVPDGLEVTLWASTPMLYNPANIDIDKDGRVWVAEGVRYRRHHAR